LKRKNRSFSAMDFGAAYNLETGLFRATFGIGMRK